MKRKNDSGSAQRIGRSTDLIYVEFNGAIDASHTLDAAFFFRFVIYRNSTLDSVSAYTGVEHFGDVIETHDFFLSTRHCSRARTHTQILARCDKEYFVLINMLEK